MAFANREYLCFGDVVLFNVQNKVTKGYVYHGLSSSPYNFLTVYTNKKDESILPDVLCASFKVLPPLKTKACRWLAELEQKNSTENRLINEAKSAAKTEENDNKVEQERRMGTIVEYGDFFQLQHIATNKFVKVCSKGSKTENNNLLVNLTHECVESCTFRLLPKYKVRSEGDKVRFIDHVKLESVSNEGQYLHCGNRSLRSTGYHVFPDCFELNLSSAESAISIIYQYSSFMKVDKGIRYGQCVRLFHKEDECYIAAEGSFADSCNPVTEDVHCRVRHVNSKRHALPSTSANTYWQIEKHNFSLQTQYISWGDKCRLKHLPTRHYLAVVWSDGQWKVTLKDKPDKDTIFKLSPFISDSKEVLFESFAMIKHCESKQWLHLDKKRKYQRKAFKPEEAGLKGLQWDSAELLMLTTSKVKEDYDSFTLQKVKKGLLEKFHYVAGVVPILSSYVQLLLVHKEESPVIDIKTPERVDDALLDLKKWLISDNERDNKNRQKLLRNLKILELMVEIIKIPEIPIRGRDFFYRDICFTIIKAYLQGESRKNENYFARFIDVFQSKMASETSAMEVLVEIVQGNIAIVTAMAETQIGYIIKEYVDSEGKYHQILDFLGSLCVCNGHPIPSTQKQILQELVLPYGKECFLRMEFDTETKELYCSGPTYNRTLLQNVDYECLESQIFLLTKLCQGRNETCISALVRTANNPEGYIGFAEAIHIIKNLEFKDMIDVQLKCIDLILAMFIDVGNNISFLDHLCYSFPYDKLSPDPYCESGKSEKVALTGVENIHFPDINKWTLSVLKTPHSYEPTYITLTLEVVCYFIRFGYYDNISDIDQHLLRPLIEMLSTYKKSTDELKIKVLEVIQLLYNFKFYVKLQMFMYDFKELDDKIKNESLGLSEIEAMELSEVKDSIYPVSYKWLAKSNARFFDISHNTIHDIMPDRQDLITVLLELTSSACPKILTASLGLLTQLHFVQEELFNMAHQSQLLTTDESLSDFHLIKDKILPEMRQLLQVDDSEQNYERIIELIKTLQTFCVIPSTTHPNKQNQIMLRNFGILTEVISFVLEKGSNMTPVSDGDLINECFKLLQVLCKGYLDAQKRVFNRVNELLGISNLSESALINLADLITETFTGGPEIILKLTECHIERIFKIIIDCKSSDVVAHFLKTLEAMTKIEEMDLPVAHIQSIIIKNFFQNYSFFSQNLLEEENGKFRLDLLKSTDNHSKVLLLLNVTSLLAACAEGNNHFIQSICQGIFSIYELIGYGEGIVSNKEISAIRRKPFLHFVIFVYLHSYDIQRDKFMIRIVGFGIEEMMLEEGLFLEGCLTKDIVTLVHAYFSKLPADMHDHDNDRSILKRFVSNSNDILRALNTERLIRMYEDIITYLSSIPHALGDITSNDIKEVITGCDYAKKRLSSHNHTDIDFWPESQFIDQFVQHQKVYKHQRELNARFNSYSDSYLVEYRGPNTVKHQLQIHFFPNSEIYSEEGEELPLGAGFQNLLKLFDEHGKAERLIKQIELSYGNREHLGEAEQVKQDTLDCRCLQVLRALIHNKIKLIDPELKQNNPKKFRKEFKDLVDPVQSKIQKFDNAIGRVIPLLSHPNEGISTEVLALMKALLFSGNEMVQEGLVESILDTREETLFLNLKERLENSELHYKYVIDLEKEQQRRMKLKSFVAPSSQIKKIFEEDVSLQQTNEGGDHEVAIPMTLLGQEDQEPLISRNVIGDGDSTKSNDSDYMYEVSASNVTKFSVLDSSRKSGLVLDVIGLMCDGQHRKLQNYLRIQPDNFRTVNVVAEVAGLLSTYTASLDLKCKNFDQINNILQALIELCVGNDENQAEVYDALIMDPINKILQLSDSLHNEFCLVGEKDKCSRCKVATDFVAMKGSAIELLDIMVEQFNPEANGVGTALNADAVFYTMTILYEMSTDPVIIDAKMNDDCLRSVYKAHHVILTLIDHNKCRMQSKDEWESNFECESLKKFVSQNTRAVEIHYTEKKEDEKEKSTLSKVYFHYDPKNVLREEVTEMVRWSINRDSMEDKQRDLLRLMPALKTDIHHQEKLKKNKFVKFFFAFHTERIRLLLLLTIIMNLFILFIYSVPDSAKGNNKVFLPTFPLWFMVVFYTLGVCHLFMSVWMVIEYFAINWPHFRLPSFFLKYKSKIAVKFFKNEKRVYTPPNVTCIDVGIFSVSTLYMILFLLCSILSLGLNGYFYCFCLLLVVVDNDILKRVLKAVTKNGSSLLWVAILGIIVLFIYAVISFAFLQNHFVETDDAALYCATLGQCMYSVLRYGLTDNLGLLIPFERSGNAPAFNPGVFTARIIFDLSFFIIVTTIGLNIVFGIIVDTFSELREDRCKIEEDQKTNCFICNLQSYEFGAKGFKDHVKDDHNMWNYIYYSIYLDQIDTGDHNAIQKYVFEMILEKDTMFFPQEEACCLTKDDDATDDKDNEIKEKVIKILQEYTMSVKQQEEKKSLEE